MSARVADGRSSSMDADTESHGLRRMIGTRAWSARRNRREGARSRDGLRGCGRDPGAFQPYRDKVGNGYSILVTWPDGRIQHVHGFPFEIEA
jgi:hypothetical protein